MTRFAYDVLLNHYYLVLWQIKRCPYYRRDRVFLSISGKPAWWSNHFSHQCSCWYEQLTISIIYVGTDVYVTNHEKQRDNEIFLSSPDGEIRTYLLPSTNDVNQIHPPSIPNTPLGTQTPRMQQTPTTGLGIFVYEGMMTYRSVYTYPGLFSGRILSNVGNRVELNGFFLIPYYSCSW